MHPELLTAGATAWVAVEQQILRWKLMEREHVTTRALLFVAVFDLRHLAWATRPVLRSLSGCV